MPVQQTPKRSPRAMVLAVAGIVLGIALVLGLFVFAIPSLTESDTIEVQLGDDTFEAGSAARLSRAIAADGPLLFSDVSSGQRDIFLQHTGTSETEDWSAFDARRPGQSRDCSLEWQRDAGEFRDPCDDTVVPATGEGLLSYPVTVTDDGVVIVDLNPDDESPDTTSE
ncbi:MAG: hypothetical protein MUE36_09155 [Acidimicrobiales bacterium]|jgi:hypothetical protein|nr:hypothetical protein [Acidimicrobiales bacterium]